MAGPLGEPVPAQVLLVPAPDGAVVGVRRVGPGVRPAPRADRPPRPRDHDDARGGGPAAGGPGCRRPPDRGRAGRVGDQRRRCGADRRAAGGRRGRPSPDRLARGGEALIGTVAGGSGRVGGRAGRTGRASSSSRPATSTCRCWASTGPAPASRSRRGRRRSRRSGSSELSATSRRLPSRPPGFPGDAAPARPGAGRGRRGRARLRAGAARGPAGARRGGGRSRRSACADRVGRADLVVTGEGTFDWQSLRGKVVSAVAAVGLEVGHARRRDRRPGPGRAAGGAGDRRRVGLRGRGRARGGRGRARRPRRNAGGPCGAGGPHLVAVRGDARGRGRRAPAGTGRLGRPSGGRPTYAGGNAGDGPAR